MAVFKFFVFLMLACVAVATAVPAGERVKKDVILGAYPYAYTYPYAASYAAAPVAYSAAYYPSAYSAALPYASYRAIVY
uniref:Unkown protein n=1 Tax=Riptortus pedestris TaxID=329032 RepID=R4WNC3_RIPPE|nr:unkown protein [Riptortus pedestris]